MPTDKQGSPEGHITHLASHLAKLGQEVIVADRSFFTSDISEQVDDFKIIRFRIAGTKPRNLERRSGSTIFSLIRTVKFTLRLTQNCSKLIYDLNPEIINTYSISSTTLLCLFCRKARGRIIYNHHASSWPISGFYSAILSSIGRITIKKIGAIVVLNSRFSGWFKAAGGKNVFTIPSGIELPSLTFNEKRPPKTILYVGRIAREKGLEFLIFAHRLVINCTRQNGLQLVLAGPFESAESGPKGEYTRKLTSFIQKLDLRYNVDLPGFVPGDKLKKLYGESFLFVLPSLRENFASSSLEAMSYGMPVISTDTTSGLAQIRDGWNGFIVPRADSKKLAEQIVTLINDPLRREEMGKNAREYAKSFDWSKIAQEHLLAYALIANSQNN